MKEETMNPNGNIVNNFYGNVGYIYNGDVTYNGSVNYSNDNKEQKQEQEEVVSIDKLVESTGQVRQYFWGDSSWAVIFCVCRDCFNYADNMSQFEREFHCQEGLLSNTFRNNTYMRLPIDKWEQNGAKERVLRLVDAYKKAVKELPEK